MSRKTRRAVRARDDADGGSSGPDTGGAERLQKVLASAGVGSRRDCEELIREGRVEVDRKVVTELGTRVDPLQQEIRVDGEALRRPKRLYFVVNKPSGVVATNYDPSGRERVIDLVPTEERVFAVGRLDRASEGLIVVTNDGEFANRLTHPRYGVSKTYLVRVAGSPTSEDLAKLRRGVHLAEGFCRIETLHVKGKHKGSTDMVIVLNEGRNREIRRILARVGHKVQRLKRIAVGKLKLADLPLGAWRRLMPTEVETLLSEAQERKRNLRGPKQPRRKAEPAEDQRLRDSHAAKRDVAAPAQLPAESDWDEEEMLPGGEPMVEITDDTLPAVGPTPRGDVIDYDEPSFDAPKQPKKQRSPKSGPPRQGRRSPRHKPGRRPQRPGSGNSDRNFGSSQGRFRPKKNRGKKRR